jgi:SAM-dependent methyltransferase
MQPVNVAYQQGCQMPLEEWVWLNRCGIFEDPELRRYVAAFPPRDLMQNVSGLTSEQDFASHGVDLFVAISKVSPKPLTEYRHILDFGCGCGRLARMFKGHPHMVSGCDIDRRHVDFINGNLDFICASLSHVHPPLPYEDNMFDGLISVSVFTHLNEGSQVEFLSELHRISAPGAYLFVTVHGERALQRAHAEERIWEMISVDQLGFDRALRAFGEGKHGFILQHGHLTRTPSKDSWLSRAKRTLFGSGKSVEPFEYGITFIPESYIRSHWARWFEITAYLHGAIHDFQDIVVMTPVKSAPFAL